MDKNKPPQNAFRLTVFFASLGFFGGLFYLLLGFSFYVALLSLILSIVLQIKLWGWPSLKKISFPESKSLKIWPVVLFSLLAISLVLLFRNSTGNALVSPWEVLPKIFWFLLYLQIIFFFKYPNSQKLLFSSFLFLLLSISALIYQLGYGFDFHIHLTAMEIISEKGEILPKTIYYSGQYALLLSFHKLLGFNLFWLNKFLFPFLGALLLPWALNKSLRFRNIDLTLALLLGFSFLTFLTPQNLGYLFLLLLLIFSFSKSEKNYRYFIGQSIIAGFCFLLQPLAGLPALAFVLWELIKLLPAKKLKIIGQSLLFLGLIFILPLAFIFTGQAKMSGQIDLELLKELIRKVSFPNNQNISLNIAYLYGFNKFLVFISLVAYGFWKKGEKKLNYFLLPLALVLGALFSSSLNFNLIHYEQNDFPRRLILTAGLLVSPWALLALQDLASRVSLKNNLTKIILTLMTGLLILGAIYNSYPRHDRYFNSKGYSSSTSDQKAIKLIAEKAKKPYLVLANQQVSVLALKKYRFQSHLENEVFFYSLPNSGPLYKYYLEMVYQKPSKEVMKKARDEVKAQEAYFVLNNYWTNYQKIKTQAQEEADSYWEIDEGKITVFYYSRD